jgi:quercetin dioxygenase-like cupin family protein
MQWSLGAKMPFIDHSDIRMPATVDRVSERYLVSSAQGAESLTIKEVQIDPGWEGRMHVHNTDVSIQVTSGAVQAIIGDEVRTVRAGTTLLAPPGTPHKLVNHLWTPVVLLITYPTNEPQTSYLE